MYKPTDNGRITISGRRHYIHIDHKPLQFMQMQAKLQNDCHQKWFVHLQ
jgi:hypothetical protein